MYVNHCHLIFWNQNCDHAIRFVMPVSQIKVGWSVWPQNWLPCARWTRFIVARKRTCLSGNRLIRSVMHPRSSSRGGKINASVTVTDMVLYLLVYEKTAHVASRPVTSTAEQRAVLTENHCAVNSADNIDRPTVAGRGDADSLRCQECFFTRQSQSTCKPLAT